jgi:hypothetical protein
LILVSQLNLTLHFLDCISLTFNEAILGNVNGIGSPLPAQIV